LPQGDPDNPLDPNGGDDPQNPEDPQDPNDPGDPVSVPEPGTTALMVLGGAWLLRMRGRLKENS
jgi:hypothetical protein